jgi:hypothetical protein
MRYIVKRYLRARLAHVTRHNLMGAFRFITPGPPVIYGDSVTSFPSSLLPRSDTSPPGLAKSLP